MSELERYAARAPFDLDEFVASANALLPQFLPDELEGGARFSGEVNVRLVRHLATLGLLDEAGRAGREARYAMRHLLQLLVVRRLMAEGYTTTAIKKLTANVEDAQLEALLRGETRAVLQSDVEIEMMQTPPANPALDYLEKIRRRAAPASSSPAPVTADTPATEPSATRWQRIEIAPGLELHRSDDYAAPTTPHERELVLKRIETELKRGRPKRSPRR